MQTTKVNELEIKIFDTRQQMGQSAGLAVAEKVKALLETQNQVNIIFAAAPSQNEFLAAFGAEELPWNKINAFHMDEYIGLSVDAPQGFGNFLRDRLFSKLPFASVNYLNGNAADIEAECRRYEQLLSQYPTDIVCMGIGENGHLAFNDPPVADFDDLKLVKQVELEAVCRQQQVNDGCFTTLDKVPTHALTLTIPALVKAPCVSIVVPAPTKAEAVYNTLNKPVSEAFPSTILRNHPSATLYLDKDSSKLIA